MKVEDVHAIKVHFKLKLLLHVKVPIYGLVLSRAPELKVETKIFPDSRTI